MSDLEAERLVAEPVGPAPLRSRGLTRRRFVQAAGLAAGGALLPSLPGCHARDSRPNFLLLLADDLNHQALGYSSGGRVLTPNLDAASAAGVRFRGAYCSAMPCAPSRGCIMSGLDLGRWQSTSRKLGGNLREGEWTWARELRAAGYHTGLIGKMHFQPMRADHGFESSLYCEHAQARRIAPGADPSDDYEHWLAEQGLRDWQNDSSVASQAQRSAMLSHDGVLPWPHDERTHPISWTRDRSIDYLDARADEGQPFCLVVSFRYPHAPYNPTPRFASLYDPTAMQVPVGDWDDLRGLPPRLRGFGSPLPRDELGRDGMQRRLAAYFALVSQIDDAVGAILERVDLSRTLVLFTSDHGDYLGERGRLEKKPLVPFEPVARVPLLGLGAGLPAGREVDEPVALVDLAPTLLEAAGLAPPVTLDGVSIQQTLARPEAARDRNVYSRGLFEMARRGPVKLLRRPRGGGEILLDLADDPGEWVNRFDDPRYRAVQDDLLAALDTLHARPPPRSGAATG